MAILRIEIKIDGKLVEVFEKTIFTDTPTATSNFRKFKGIVIDRIQKLTFDNIFSTKKE